MNYLEEKLNLMNATMYAFIVSISYDLIPVEMRQRIAQVVSTVLISFCGALLVALKDSFTNEYENFGKALYYFGRAETEDEISDVVGKYSYKEETSEETD